MEDIRAELSTVLGESLSRMEQIGEQPYAHLYTLYNQQGHSLPVLAKTYLCQGIAQQEAYKLSILAREGTIRMPTVYGILPLPNEPYHELLIVERLPGLSVETPIQTPGNWPGLMDQIIESVLAWHRIDSRGYVGTVDNCQRNNWDKWYQQRVEVLWATLSRMHCDKLDHEDRAVLFRSKEHLAELFTDFDDNAVLVHGNLTLHSMLKDPDSDQLLSMINPGMMLWAPREYELFRLSTEGMPTQLLYRYLERAPVSESFMVRRWLYLIWEAVARYLHTGRIKRDVFKYASQNLLPWL